MKWEKKRREVYAFNYEEDARDRLEPVSSAADCLLPIQRSGSIHRGHSDPISVMMERRRRDGSPGLPSDFVCNIYFNLQCQGRFSLSEIYFSFGKIVMNFIPILNMSVDPRWVSAAPTFLFGTSCRSNNNKFLSLILYFVLQISACLFSLRFD